MGQRVYARFPFKYARRDLDRGELLEFVGTANDERLLGMKYFIRYDPLHDIPTKCDNCSREFAGPQYLLEHRKKKGGCMSVEQKTTNRDTAILLNVDPENLKMPSETDIHVDETTEMI